MGDGGYKIRSQAAIHFITFAVVEWVDVFTRKEYRDIVLESIRHCQQEKGFNAKRDFRREARSGVIPR